MFLGKDIMGNPIIAISNGQSIGNVKDVYLSADCRSVAGIYLGSEGLFSRKYFLIKSEDMVTIGRDAVLVTHSEVIHKVDDLQDSEEAWLRRDELQGRPVDTPGGTKVGKVGDIILDKEGKVLGFDLSPVYVAGPIAANGSIALHTVEDVGSEDGVMTIDLEQAEQQKLL
ncbi:MAG: PRC-barrel domain-containing protein [Candidatus Promineifilaceae bacterium]|nr:PRC-barrel domain-containing protein [Candidatus Promineifilaceae bacterium]